MVSFGPIGISSCCCRWFHVGPSAYAPAAADGFAWAHRNKQLLLPMVSCGPIGICSCCRRWAHYFPNSCCCRWLCMGLLECVAAVVDGFAWAPSKYAAAVADGVAWARWHTQLLPPMVSHGPIGICSCSTAVVVNGLAWAHYFSNRCCRQLRLGPLEYAAAISDGFVRTHRHMDLLLPMISCGPVGICACACQKLRMGPLAHAAAVADDFVWAH
jgi:hypothetical protein